MNFTDFVLELKPYKRNENFETFVWCDGDVSVDVLATETLTNPQAIEEERQKRCRKILRLAEKHIPDAHICVEFCKTSRIRGEWECYWKYIFRFKTPTKDGANDCKVPLCLTCTDDQKLQQFFPEATLKAIAKLKQNDFAEQPTTNQDGE